MVHHIRLSKCVSRWVEGGFYKTYLRPPQQPTAIFFFAKYWYYYSDYTICPIRAIEIFNQLLSLFKLLYCSYSTTTEIYLKTSSGHCHGHHWLNGCGWCILNKFLNNVWKLPHSAFFLWVVQQSKDRSNKWRSGDQSSSHTSDKSSCITSEMEHGWVNLGTVLATRKEDVAAQIPSSSSTFRHAIQLRVICTARTCRISFVLIMLDGTDNNCHN